jgi:DNA-binding FrmR family transcriptional regulator
MSGQQTDVDVMAAPHQHFSYEQDALLARLRRIEGQVRGVRRMVEEGRYCLDIVTQIQAITAAADKVSQQVLEEHIRGCVTDAIKDQRGDEAISELMSVLGRAMRR